MDSRQQAESRRPTNDSPTERTFFVSQIYIYIYMYILITVFSEIFINQ